MRQYTEKPLDLISIAAAARGAAIDGQRFRRAVQILKIPVFRSGWNVLISEKQVSQVVRALSDGTIRRGRPSKKKA